MALRGLGSKDTGIKVARGEVKQGRTDPIISGTAQEIPKRREGESGERGERGTFAGDDRMMANSSKRN